MALQKSDFSNKSALVIDASSLVRSSTMAMLATLGFGRVKGSTTSDRALELVKQGEYDLVLVGHAITERHSGIQILEEARHRGLIKPSACWGFMSSDNSPEVILHATASEPDFVIGKPFSIGDLLKRLQSGLNRKQAVKPINQALDAGNLSRALEFCDFVLDKDLSMISVKQMKADLLLQTQDYQQALLLLEEIAAVAPNNKVEIKICEALIACGQREQALGRLDKLIADSPLLIRAYDLKAQAFEEAGQYSQSMNVLSTAVNITSMSIPRNLKLAKLALFTKQLDLAESSYKRSIALHEGSCYKTPEPYLGLANVKRIEIKLDRSLSAEIEQKIDVLLKDAQSNFPDNPELKVQIALFKEQLQLDLNNPSGAREYHALAEKIITDQGLRVDINNLMESALGLMPKFQSEAIIAAPVQSKPSAEPEKSSKVNLQGIKQYLNNNRAKALKYFTMAFELNRQNSAALLNLAQMYLEALHFDQQGQEKSRRMAKRYLTLIENVTKNDVQQQRYSLLKEYLLTDLQGIPKGCLGMLLR
ncbi:MAG: hypothetical protein OFPI_34460 [Osedax symbiont Rs2]|nr:MAG: hypothetical protein OFPI_34460 [Osedax symbiont Rs2]